MGTHIGPRVLQDKGCSAHPKCLECPEDHCLLDDGEGKHYGRGHKSAAKINGNP